MSDTNLKMFEAILEELGSVRDEVVFLGGAVVGLLVDTAATADVRPTGDLDCVAEDPNLSLLYGSHDLEDMVVVVDGRSTIVDELLHKTTRAARQYLGEQVDRMWPRLTSETIPGALRSDLHRVTIVEKRFEEIRAMQDRHDSNLRRGSGGSRKPR